MLNGIIVVTGIGMLLGVLLVVVSKFMQVQKDETAEEVRAMLPGANCGACGYAGCDDYAAKLASGEEKNASKCIPGGSSTARNIAQRLGLPFEEIAGKKAIVRCHGTADTSVYVMEYHGPLTCKACNSFYQGQKSCSHGCLGFGDCAEKCSFNAIMLRNGLAIVDKELCTGCGACESACPNKLITRIPETARVFVACNSHDKGAYTRQICVAGCIGCMRCQKTCPVGAITVTDNLASVNQELCVSCGKCVEVCPTKVIQMY